MAIATIVAYAPVQEYGFVDLDDPGYVQHNPNVGAGLTWNGVKWAFSTGHAANWHPLTWLSHMLDVELFGLDAGAHHVVNLAFHTVNGVLLLLVLARATGALWPSAFVAGVFALHPTHVESVAWIAERKDVLSTLFWMMTLWAYVAYARQPSSRRYWLVAIGLTLGLMAKPMLVTLPFLLLLLDYWPLARPLPFVQLVREKIPLFILVVLSSAITLVVQQRGGAVSSFEVVPISLRLANAVIAYVIYISKTFWPTNLAVFYPYPRTIAPGLLALSAVVLIVLSVLALRWRVRRPYFTVGWAWYLLTLLPVVGLIQVGTQAMADRYTYVPSIGLAVAVSWLAASLPAASRRFAAILGAVALVALAVTTRGQVKHWESSLTLWQRAVDATSENARARNSLAAVLGNQGRPADAIVHLQEALRLNPDRGEAFHVHHNLGRALADLGRVDEAIAHYRDALRLKPVYPEAHNNLGLALAKQGQLEAAMAEYRLALADDPAFDPAINNLANAHNDLGFSLFAKGLTTDAVREYTEAIRLRPAFALAYNHRGFARAASGNLKDAISDFREAAKLDPQMDSAFFHLGLAFAALGQFAEAEQNFIQALQINPANESAKRALERLKKR